MTIKSLAVIPHLSCTRRCEYCYEKKKEYGKSLPSFAFHQSVCNKLDVHTDIEEVLVDANAASKGSNRAIVNSIVLASVATRKKVIITTIPRELPFYAKLEVKFHISLHNYEDIRIFAGLYRRWFRRNQKIESVSVMVRDVLRKEFLDYFSSLIPKEVPVYLLVDKFGEAWKGLAQKKKLCKEEDPLKALLTLQAKGYDVTMDHCLLTVLNNQECPASNQLNMYRDGTSRLCPYEPMPEGEKDREAYAHGLGVCYFNQRRLNAKPN